MLSPCQCRWRHHCSTGCEGLGEQAREKCTEWLCGQLKTLEIDVADMEEELADVTAGVTHSTRLHPSHPSISQTLSWHTSHSLSFSGAPGKKSMSGGRLTRLKEGLEETKAELAKAKALQQSDEGLVSDCTHRVNGW